MKLFVATMLTLIITNFSFADSEKSQPCMEVKKACESAGFEKGKHKEGKGLVKDCMAKLSAGEPVDGVTVSAELVSACKDKREAHKDKREERKNKK